MIRSEDCGVLAGSSCSVDYTIHVPQGVHVTATSIRGDITVSGANVDLSSSEGDVTLHGVTTDGLVRDSVDVESSGGDVTLSFSRTPMEVVADSRGGSVVIEVPDTPDSYRVLASSSGGDATTRIRTDRWVPASSVRPPREATYPSSTAETEHAKASDHTCQLITFRNH